MRPSTPRQLIKVVFGLRGSEERCGLTLCSTDSTLMEMDAPACLPSGSMRRTQPLPDSDPAYIQVRESIAFREPLANGKHY